MQDKKEEDIFVLHESPGESSYHDNGSLEPLESGFNT